MSPSRSSASISMVADSSGSSATATAVLEFAPPPVLLSLTTSFLLMSRPCTQSAACTRVKGSRLRVHAAGGEYKDLSGIRRTYLPPVLFDLGCLFGCLRSILGSSGFSVGCCRPCFAKRPLPVAEGSALLFSPALPGAGNRSEEHTSEL